MSTSKEIRHRIRSATNTKQIIKAMELVSVIKMQKAITANQASRPYTAAADGIIKEICNQISAADHNYFKAGKKGHKLVILLTTDRGLCGNLNTKVIKKLLDDFGTDGIDIIAVGKKGRDLALQFGLNLIAEFFGATDNPGFKDEYPILKLIEKEFKTGKYESISMIYPHYISTLSQEAISLQLLPLETTHNGAIDDSTLYEPGKTEVLNDLIPRVLETILWQCLLETIASEHSARMITMKNANENAEELIDDLTLSFNQSRQANITRELAEISAGKMTLEE
jgi:F-type H+-transporting ATPase subunit gamma